MPPMLKPVLLALAVVSALTAPASAHAPRAPETPGLGAPAPVEPVDLPTPPPAIDTVGLPAPAPPAVTNGSATRWSDAQWFLLALLAAAVVAGARCRRALAGTVAALLVFFAFESAVHSVHHLDSDTEAARCAIASAANHLNGLTGEPIAVGQSEAPAEALIADVQGPPLGPLVRAIPGRSPPLAASPDAVSPRA
jgi:hypothetical protein